jgi:hypothetical protein
MKKNQFMATQSASAFHTAPISPSTTQRSLQLMAVLQPKQNQKQQQPWEPEAY